MNLGQIIHQTANASKVVAELFQSFQNLPFDFITEAESISINLCDEVLESISSLSEEEKSILEDLLDTAGENFRKHLVIETSEGFLTLRISNIAPDFDPDFGSDDDDDFSPFAEVNSEDLTETPPKVMCAKA